jgi:CRP-like cAMP-binding protein
MTSRTELEALTVLRSLALTHNLETKHLRKLASLASKVEFSEGEIVYRDGDIGEAVYVIEEGEVVIEMNAPGQGYVVVLTVGPGELFGWSSLFPAERKMARARVISPTRAIAINASRLQAAWRTDHELETAIIRCAARVMADRIKATRRQLVEALTST